MSSFTNADSDRAWALIEDRIQTIPLKANQAVVQRWLALRDAQGKAMSTLGSDASLLSLWGEFLQDVPFVEVTQDHILQFMRSSPARASGRGRPGRTLAKSTRHQRRTRLLTFYSWLCPETAQALFEGTRVPRPKATDLRRKKVISGDDLDKVIRAAPHDRDRTVVKTLYETGFRAGELCALNVGSVHFSDDYAEVSLPDVPGLKTGPRSVVVIDVLPDLLEWYEQHPNKNDREAPLFHSLGRRKMHGRLLPTDLYAIVRRLGERAELGYRLHPHMLRHTQATEKARLGWNEAKMRIWFGWSKDSDEPSTYIHLDTDQVHKAWLAERGLLEPESTKRGALQGPTCAGCGSTVPVGRDHCRVCRLPVDAASKRTPDVQKHELMEMMAAEVARQVKAALGAAHS